MAIKSTLWSLIGSAAFIGFSGAVVSVQSASAGHAADCGPNGDCAMSVKVLPSPAPIYGPMTIENRTPFDRRHSIQFQRAPHVSILRVHGLAPSAELSDGPSGFTDGCHPSSTKYCRVHNNDPLLTGPMPQPWQQSVQRSGQQSGAQTQPRPTPPQILQPLPILTPPPHQRPIHRPVPLHVQRPAPQHVQRPTPMPAPRPMPAPARPQLGPVPIRAFTTPPVPQAQGTIVSPVGIDGSYWEKVSGPTLVGGLTATEVLCKRQLPAPPNPVYGVPQPMPPVCAPNAPQPTGHLRY